MNVAVIPARGGSKGIPDKNLCKVGGLSLVARAVIAARNAEWIHCVAVTSDSDAILEEAANYGAEVVERPAELATDTSTSEEALLHALAQFPDADKMAFLQCTSPFTRPEDIDACMAMLDRDYDCAFTVVETHSGYWQGPDVRCISHNAGIQRKGRQITLPTWRETGGVYAMRVKGFVAARNRFFGKLGMFPVSEKSAFEIDNPYDLTVARAIAELL